MKDTGNLLLGRCRMALPKDWRPPGLLRRFLSAGHMEFFGPDGSSIKFAIGPICPELTVEEQKRNLERIASKHGHTVLTTGEIEVAGKKHATMTCKMPHVGVLKTYSLILDGIEYLVTAKGDPQVCDAIVRTFRAA
ncbi:MAG: hypothetical protein WBW16_11160 [Bacteroidota bacterium]